MRPRRLPFGLMLMTALGGCAVAPEDGLSQTWATRFEQSVLLDDLLRADRSYRDTLSLQTYSRHYVMNEKDGRPMVHAVFRASSDRAPGIHIGEPLPIIRDGGCGVITLWIDLETLEVISAGCNGEA